MLSIAEEPSVTGRCKAAPAVSFAGSEKHELLISFCNLLSYSSHENVLLQMRTLPFGNSPFYFIKLTGVTLVNMVIEGSGTDCWAMCQLYSGFWGTPYCWQSGCTSPFPSAVDGQGFPVLHNLAITCLVLTGVRWFLVVVLMYIPLTASEAEHLFIHR